MTRDWPDLFRSSSLFGSFLFSFLSPSRFLSTSPFDAVSLFKSIFLVALSPFWPCAGIRGVGA